MIDNKKEMESKYRLILYINILEVILALGIITLAGIFNNWHLLWLLILLGTSSTEKRILDIKEE